MTTISIVWIIERLLCKPVEGTLTDVVITADWRCNGSQESFNGTCYGSTSFAPPTENFTPYDQLTEAQVLGWCYSCRRWSRRSSMRKLLSPLLTNSRLFRMLRRHDYNRTYH